MTECMNRQEAQLLLW